MKRSEFLKQIGRTLRQRRRELQQVADAEWQELRNEYETNIWDDPVEELDTLGDDLSSRLAEHACDELIQIDRAMERLSDGTYGICEECDRTISLARLQALPYVTTCIRCAEQRESGAVPRGEQRREWPANRWWTSGPRRSRAIPVEASF